MVPGHPCHRRGLPIPNIFRITSAKLKPAAWITRRFRMFSRPRKCTRLMPPVSYRCAKLLSANSQRSFCKTFAPLTAHPTPVRVDLFLLGLLAPPFPTAPLRFRNVASHTLSAQLQQCRAAMISLVRHHLFHAPLVDLLGN